MYACMYICNMSDTLLYESCAALGFVKYEAFKMLKPIQQVACKSEVSTFSGV